MTDIVERLREGCGCNFPETTCMAESECADAFAAADEITALRAENERLRAALWDIHAVCNNWDWFIWMWPIRRIKRIARAALEEK